MHDSLICCRTFGEAGRLQPFFYTEDWDFAAIAGVTDQNIQQTGFGINWFITGTNNVRLTIERQITEFERPTAILTGTGVNPTGFTEINNTRAMFQVAF